MRFDAKLIVPAGLLVLAACTPVDAGFGEAVRYDLAVQTIDPDPQFPPDGAKPGDHGEKAQKATERYRKGQTKPAMTQGVSGGAAGGAGGVGAGNTPGS